MTTRIMCQNPQCPMAGYCDGYCPDFIMSDESLQLGVIMYHEGVISVNQIRELRQKWMNGFPVIEPEDRPYTPLVMLQQIKAEREMVLGFDPSDLSALKSPNATLGEICKTRTEDNPYPCGFVRCQCWLLNTIEEVSNGNP